MSIFGAAHGQRGARYPLLLYNRYIYPATIKFGVTIPYSKKFQKHVNRVTHFLSFAGINIAKHKQYVTWETKIKIAF